MAGRRRSDRALRDKLRSPGRPPVARREDRRRFWMLIATGLSSEDAALRIGISQPVGFRFARRVGWPHRTCHELRECHLCGIPDLRIGRRSLCCGPRGWASGRLHVVSDARHRRCRGSCGATRRRGAAIWITGRRSPNGMRSGQRSDQSLRSLPSTRHCGLTYRIGWLVPWPHRAGQRCLGRRCRGKADGMGDDRTGDGLWLEARSRLPNACGSTFRATASCASATRRCTRRLHPGSGCPEA